nr:hypothetical protein [Tanacetum cinerariifolium]
MLFPVWSTGSLNPQNKEGDAAFDRKEHDAEEPESAVNLSSNSSALSGEQDDMTKKKDQGKSPVKYFTGNRELNADFKDYSEDSSNDVSAAGPIVPTARKNYSNSTNPFSAAEIKDIAYSDHENVGTEADIYQIDMYHARKVLSMQEDESEVQEVVESMQEDESEVHEVVEVVTTAKLITELVAVVSETVSAADVLPTVTAAPVKVVVPSTRRRRGVIIRDPEEESSAKTPIETKSKDKGKGIMVEEPKPMKRKQQVELDKAYARKLQEELNQDIDWEVAIDHVKQKAKEDPFIQRYQVMKKRPQTKAQAQQNMIMYLKNTAGFRLDYFKGMSYDDIRLIFESKFNANMEFLLKSKEYIEEEANRATESINKTPAQKAAKRRRRNEEVKDVEEIKQHLEIVPDEDDDVYTEATPLVRKVPVVDYQIVHFNNKPHFKIICADGTHQMYVSFITLLKNFDREDLESLWSLVKERFSTLKPNNFSDDYLLTTLRAMFGRPDGQDLI